MPTRSTCALVLLCLVQGCERFAFFAVLPLFSLYLHERHGFTEPTALLLLGIFHALSYFGAWPASLLSDRKLGPVTATLIGAPLLTLGYGVLVLDQRGLLWLALALMILGHNLFKPNLGTLLGGLYSASDARRERGFLWHHLAVNLGAMLGPLWTEHARVRGDWPRVFFGACGVMFLGAFLLALGAVTLGADQPLRLSTAPAGTSTTSDRERQQAVWLICGLALIFWLAAQQTGSSLVLFAETHTLLHVMVLNRRMAIGPGHFASLHALLVLALVPLLTTAMTWLRRRHADPSTPAKMLWGYRATAAAFALLSVAGLHGGDTGRVHPAWLGGGYLFLSLAEILLAPFGLSLLTKLAPPQKRSQTLGLWFASIAVGNLLAGALGLLWGRWPPHRYFALISLLSIGAAALLRTQLRRLQRAIRSDS